MGASWEPHGSLMRASCASHESPGSPCSRLEGRLEDRPEGRLEGRRSGAQGGLQRHLNREPRSKRCRSMGESGHRSGIDGWRFARFPASEAALRGQCLVAGVSRPTSRDQRLGTSVLGDSLRASGLASVLASASGRKSIQDERACDMKEFAGWKRMVAGCEAKRGQSEIQAIAASRRSRGFCGPFWQASRRLRGAAFPVGEIHGARPKALLSLEPEKAFFEPESQLQELLQ